MKTHWQFLTKLNTEIPYELSILLLHIQPKEMVGVQTKTYTQMFKVALLRRAKSWK